MRILLIGCLVAVAGCGRTALEPPYDPSKADAAMDHPRDLRAEKTDAPPDLPADLPKEHPPDLRPETQPDTKSCLPKDEECNGLDDDCDGVVDDHLPPIPCANPGDVRLCVGGHYSECPKRCGICVPNSERTCITSFCTFWGRQTCSADGMSFSRCIESEPPPECKPVADKMMRSRELEECCIRNNFCCVDEFDVDGDGDTKEMLGRCETVVCE